MSILNVEHLSHGFGDRAIFEDVSFRLLKGEHIGLVGANGEGKSTFMNIITGKLMPDEGKVEWAKNVRVGYLDQHTVLEKGMTIRDVLKSAFSWLYEMEERMNTICDSMGDASEDELNAMMEELGVIQEMMDAHDFYILDSRIEEIGRALGLEEIGLERDVTELSGGQRTKVLLAKLLLEKGADINYHKPDMVFPYASSPVTEAARSNNFLMVRWLVEQGADITIADKYGDRPYTVAVQNKNQELADYLKALEPEDWHNEQEKARQLMPYKLPAKLVEYLKTGPLRLEFPEQEWVKWVELYSYMDVQEMTWKRKKLLSLMVQMDNYSDYLLLWSPRDKKLWYLDIEHEEFHPLAKWDDFIADPGRYLNGMIEGEFEE